MLARKSTHKRKRSSARADTARARHPTRFIANFFPDQPSSSQQPADRLRIDPRIGKLIDQHPFNHSLELIVPFKPATSEQPEGIAAELSQSIQSLLDRLSKLTSHDRAASFLAKVPLSLFLDPIFVTAYIRCGSLTALSLGRIDSDDVVCLDGQGTLILSLTKDTYQTLGLTGRPSHFSRLSSGRAGDRQSGAVTRYIVELPILSPSFVPGKKGYQQALSCLRRWDAARAGRSRMATTLAESQLVGQMYAGSSKARASLAGATSSDDPPSGEATWDVLFSWTPNEESDALAEVDAEEGVPHGLPTTINFPSHLVDPRSVRKFDNHGKPASVVHDLWLPRLGKGSGLSVKSSKGERKQPQESVPGIERLRGGWVDKGKGKASDDQATWQEWQLLAQEAVEWLGLASLEADIIKTYWRADDYCRYAPPSPCEAGSVVKLQWRGFLSSRLLNKVAAEVEHFLDTDGARDGRGWASLAVGGFSDAPISWRSKIALSSQHGAAARAASKSAPTSPSGPVAAATNTNPSPQNVQQAAMEVETDAGSSSEGATDSGSDSDASLDMDAIFVRSDKQTGKAARKKRAKKVKRRGHVRKGETEHGFKRRGEDGWVALCFGSRISSAVTDPAPAARWILIESLEADLRS